MSKSIIMGKVFWIIGITLAAIVLLFATGCKKEEITGDIVYPIPHWPAVKALDVTHKTDSSATLNGTVNAYGLPTIVTFEYGSTTNYDSTVTAYQIPVSGDSIINVRAKISGLTLCMPYHFRVRAENSLWTNFYSSDKTFTVGQAPDVYTVNATNVSPIDATLNGMVNANGLPATVTFEYGPTTSYGNTLTANPGTVKGAATTNVSADLTGLTKGTSYHYRLKAEKSCGTVYGRDVEFTTLSQAPPAVNTIGATNITSTTATLTGDVLANNLSSVVTFEYGTTTNYGQVVTSEQSPATGNSIINVSATIEGLTTCATYHFRIKAENELGAAYGNDLTFKIKQAPTLTTTSATDITATNAISGGIITDDGCEPITDRGVELFIIRIRTVILVYKTHDGTGTGSFTSALTGLRPSTRYVVRAYATNSSGTAYGNQIYFTTPAIGK
jgi:hypothetical protein